MEEILVDIRNESRIIKRIFENKDMVSIEELLAKIEELDDNVEHYKKELQDTIQDRDDNYKPIPYSEQI